MPGAFGAHPLVHRHRVVRRRWPPWRTTAQEPRSIAYESLVSPSTRFTRRSRRRAQALIRRFDKGVRCPEALCRAVTALVVADEPRGLHLLQRHVLVDRILETI